MFCQSVLIGRCQSNLKRFLPLSSYQLHTLEEHNLTITSGFPEQISNCLRNLFVVQLRRLRWFKHNESCAKPNLTSICPLDMRAKPERSRECLPGSRLCLRRPAVTPCSAWTRALKLLSSLSALCYIQHSLLCSSDTDNLRGDRSARQPSPIGPQSPWTDDDWLRDYNLITHVNRALENDLYLLTNTSKINGY